MVQTEVHAERCGTGFFWRYSVPYRVVVSTKESTVFHTEWLQVKKKKRERERGKLKSPARQQSQRRGLVHETFRIRKKEQFQFKTD